LKPRRIHRLYRRRLDGEQEARVIAWVCGSSYEVFTPVEAKRIPDRLEFHSTPKHGSWLYMAEIELSVLNRQCLIRWIPGQDAVIHETSTWALQRNDK
jgi:hypothetical protein